ARLPMSDVAIGFVDEDPAAKRLIRATIGGIRICSAYVPNGKSPLSPSFAEKLAWFGRLQQTVAHEISGGRPVLICGDFNVAPDERDVFDPEVMRGQIHFHPEEHRVLADLVSVGLVDVFRAHHPEGGSFSWWDYRRGGFDRNLGLRIDLIYATP